MKPLSGIRVLDLSRVLAGPLCGQALGDLGAEVIKIETPGQGDESRSWPPFHDGMATAYIAANRNKKSVALNLKTPEGQELLHRMVREADVVIESAATGVSERLRVDYATLKALNPRLIYLTISGFGRTGPLKDLRGYDMILQAYSGMMSLTGEKGGAPIRIPFSPIDQATGYHGVIGVLSALIQRSISGQGCYLEVSLLETAVSFLGYTFQAYLEQKTLPGRNGSRHGGIAPYQAFDCADKTVLIGIANDKLWRAFCQSFQLDHMAADPRFATNRDRVAHCDAVAQVVQEVIGALPIAEVLPRLEAAGIPCAPINTLQDVLDDPQVAHLGLLKSLRNGASDTGMMAVMMPILFDNAPRDPGSPPPRLGEHSETVLTALGLSATELADLAERGVIGGLPATSEA